MILSTIHARTNVMLEESRRFGCNDYDNRWSRYRIRPGKGDPKKHTELLRELFTTAHKEFGASNG